MYRMIDDSFTEWFRFYYLLCTVVVKNHCAVCLSLFRVSACSSVKHVSTNLLSTIVDIQNQTQPCIKCARRTQDGCHLPFVDPVLSTNDINKFSASGVLASRASGSVLRRGLCARARTHTDMSIPSILASSSYVSNENNARRGGNYPSSLHPDRQI